jgi:Mpv17 / PMP22 family
MQARHPYVRLGMAASARVLHLHSARLWQGYNASLKSNPIATKSLTCATAYAVGDTIAQLSTSRQHSLPRRLAALDPVRTARLALFGLLWTGPTGHVFYNWLERVRLCFDSAPAHALTALSPWRSSTALGLFHNDAAYLSYHSLGTSAQMVMPQMPGHALSIAGKVALDQLLYTPVCTAAFFAWVNALSGTPDKIGKDITEKLLPSTVAAWCLWAPASTFNMAVVPMHLRMLFINGTSDFVCHMR